jgi:hypothetical protein
MDVPGPAEAPGQDERPRVDQRIEHVVRDESAAARADREAEGRAILRLNRAGSPDRSWARARARRTR